MAVLGNIGSIEIVVPLRRVNIFQNPPKQGWFHGFYNSKDGPVAVIELDDGHIMVVDRIYILDFDEPYSKDTAYELKR